MRAQAIVRLSQGLTLQQLAYEFGVHLNSVAQWRQRWNRVGLAGLYEGIHSGRPPKRDELQRQALRDLAEEQEERLVHCCAMSSRADSSKRRAGIQSSAT
jgi:transposase